MSHVWLQFSQESTARTGMRCRRRPLHTCGASILAMSHNAYMKVQGFNGPIGSVTKKMATLATSACPFVYAIQCQWLALLSFADDRILAIEDKIERLFPPSTHVFNKLDELLHIAETLPGRFDDAADRLPMIIQRFPLLDWVLAHVVSWLNFFLSLLADWGTDAAREKEIMVDINCTDPNNGSSSVDKVHQIESRGESEHMVKSPAEVEGEVLKCTYKEALEKGTKYENEMKEDDSKEIVKTMLQKKEVGLRTEKNGGQENEKNGKEESMQGMVIEGEVEVETEKNVSKDEECISNDDPILELFESGWHMKPGRGAQSPLQSQSKLEEWN